MTPERWQLVDKLFEAALELAPEARAAFLDDACAGDMELRREVEALLASDARASGFLDAPAEGLAPLADDESMPGRRIGAYQIVRQIGRGGMGAVYLAVRADGAYEKQVAIKLIPRGLATAVLHHRFQRERRILATLDHPNIAKLLDGGTTEDGQSYFIMDYVEGLPIDVYCDRHKLPTVERLQLFRVLCSAVEYAHGKHVVHRDLKPSNIAVTPEGVIKLLDFGIAKVLHPEPAPEMVSTTALWHRPMTFAYASPEQVRGELITPASDVYSLGVLLYELLTGHPPYRGRRRTPAEFERVICEEEPEKPSMAVRRIEEVPNSDGTTRTTLTPDSLSGTRDGRPETLCRRLAGDLDNIVLMALRKEPAQRYASAELFSEDIGRYLEGRPVIAHRDTLVYRTGKFLKRHPGRFIAGVLGAVVILALLTGGWYWRSQRAVVRDAIIPSPGEMQQVQGVHGVPGLIQGRFGDSHRKNFELVVPLATAGFAHLMRDNDDVGYPWLLIAIVGARYGRVDAATLIQSNFSASESGPGHLEAVARVGNRLIHFPRSDASQFEKKWGVVHTPAVGVSGNPVLIQSRFGKKGHFEVVVPLASGGIAHYSRDNDARFLPWSQPAVFGKELGQVDAVAFIQSNFSQGGPGNFEVIARRGSDLFHLSREDVPPFAWSRPTFIATGATGNPALMQSRFGKKGNFELLVPAVNARGLAYYTRANDKPDPSWIGPTYLGAGQQHDAVTLIQSNFTRGHPEQLDGPGTFEVVARISNQLVAYWRDNSEPFAWHGPRALNF